MDAASRMSDEAPTSLPEPESTDVPAPDPPVPVEVRLSEPVPQAVIASGPVDATLEAARQEMRAVYDKARAAGFQLGALINSGCDIIEFDGSAIVIGFKYPIHAQKASEKPNLDALAAIVSEVMGRRLSVRCVHEPNVEAWNQRSAGSRSALVKAAQEMGGRILSSEPED